MNYAGCRNQCDPYAYCRTWCKGCKTQQPPPTKTEYIFVAKAPDKEKKTRPRSSSADSAKSTPSAKKSKGSFSKSTSSDSKVLKKKKPKRTAKDDGEKKGEMDPRSVQQLKEDLKTIKDQLMYLTKNRNEALEITDELQVRYTELVKRNKEQERQIEELKQVNKKLLEKTRQRIGEGPHVDEAIETKKHLDEYESKLNTLYGELLSSTKAMEESRDKICRCIKDKDDEFKQILNSSRRLSQSLEQKSADYEKLLKEKEELYLTVKQLEEQLNGSVKELERMRNETEVAQQETKSLSVSFADQLEEKSQEIERLKSASVCKCDYQKVKADYQQLQKEHEETMQKLKAYEKFNSQRFEEVKRLRKNEKKVAAQMGQMQNYVNQVTEANNRQKALLERLENQNQEKDSTIQCQKAQLAYKDKQIEILQRSEDRLKKRTIQLQEEMVSMRIDRKPQSVLTTEDCSVHLTEELQDLITALYDEIDKTSVKDEQLQEQHRRICYLECALNGKEKELICVRKELKILRDRLAAATLSGKREGNHLTRAEEDCGLEDCDCAMT